MELTPTVRSAYHEWPEMTVEELKSPADNALATGPFGSSIGSRFFEKQGVPVIRGNNLSTDGSTQFVDDGLVFISEAKAAEFRRSTATKGDLIFTCWGTINQVGLIGRQCAFDRYIISNKQMKFTPHTSKADSIFLYYLFSSPAIQRTIISQSIGSSIPGFNLGQLRKMRLRVPSLPEQRAIAEALGDVDALLGALDQLIAKKRDLKLAAMQELLCPKSGWVVKKLEDVADVIDPHPSHRAPPAVPGGIPFVGIGDLNESGDLIGTKIRTVDPSVLDEHMERYDLNEELIGLGRVASIGKVVKLKNTRAKYAISPTLGVIRGTKVRRDYLLCALKSRAVTDQFNRIMSGSTRSSVGMVVLRRLDIDLPADEAEQTAIAKVLSDMDAELAVLAQRRDKTLSLKQGMMQELLTGRTRLV